MDPQADPLGHDQELGVEEPLLVLDERQQPHRHVAAERLEPALGVAEATPEGDVQQRVVAPGDDLSYRTPHHAGPRCEPGADRDVAVARDERGHQRQEGVEPGRQVDVEIGDHRGVAGRPRGPQRPTPPLLVEVDGAHPREGVGQRHGLVPGAIGAGVVGDGDAGGQGELPVHEVVQGPDTRLDLRDLVVDGNDDVDVGVLVHHESGRSV